MLYTSPIAARIILRKCYWRIPNQEKVIYLTFDDGPTPNITETVLVLLKQYNAKATFFCVGKNAEKHPEIISEIQKQGHTLGNHTYSHPKGWTTNTKDYIDNVQKCDKVFYSKIFRPPYGKISLRQYRQLKRNKKIIMWDVLTRDYDHKVNSKKCLSESLKRTRNGSIIVFHDSQKAKENLLFVLPKFLAFFSKKGFTFEPILM